MSSNQNNDAKKTEPATRSIGWDSGIRLGVYYALFFTLVFGGILTAAHWGFAPVVHERELNIVRNRAAEYRAWFQSGDLEMLEARINEQSMQSGDVMFVRVIGRESDFIKFLAPGGGKMPMEELRNLDMSIEGVGIELGGDRWAITSVDLGDGIVLQAGKNLRASEATLARLRRISLLIFVPAMILATIGGAWLTYRAMSPIRRLIRGMQEILRAGDLGRRIEPESGRNELNALVDVFNQLLARNESLIEAMRDSLDNVAHDFRTPLSRLRITAERALLEGSDPEQIREALGECVEESEHLGRLLTTLMEVAEAESGAMRLDFEDFSLPDLVESVVELYELVAEDKQIAIETVLPKELIIRADRTRLGQAIANLLDNAIKYSTAGGRVSLSLAQKNDSAIITVLDKGTGIGEQDLPHIWDRLFRAERSRSAPGMGLGLSFVKAIIEAHGGTVSVKSSLEQGSTFQAELPSNSDSKGTMPSN